MKHVTISSIIFPRVNRVMTNSQKNRFRGGTEPACGRAIFPTPTLNPTLNPTPAPEPRACACVQYSCGTPTFSHAS